MGAKEALLAARKTPWAWLGVLAVMVVVGVVLATPTSPGAGAPKKSPKLPAQPKITLSIAPQHQAAIVAHARALLEGRAPTTLPSEVAEICGRQVFVQLFRNQRKNYAYAVSERTQKAQLCLPEALSTAVQQLKAQRVYKRAWAGGLAQARVGVSVVSSDVRRIKLTYHEPKEKMNSTARKRVGWRFNSKAFAIGLDGLYLRGERDGKVYRHWAPPIEGVVRSHGHEDNWGQLRAYARDQFQRVQSGKTKERADKPNVRAYSYRTQLMVERAPASQELPLEPVRGNQDPGRVDADDIYLLATRMTDYLVRILDEEGRFIYEYHADQDRDAKTYNIVRHAGTTYSLLVTYAYTGDKRYLEAGLRAKDYMVRNLSYQRYVPHNYVGSPSAVPVPFPEADGSVKLLALEMNGRVALGATSLALLAFAQIPPDALKPDDEEYIRQMVNFTWFLQCESGGFYNNYPMALKGQCPDPQPLYFPGETLLALSSLYQVKPHPAYLSIARKSIGFELKAFHDGRWPDHWVMQALNLMDANTPQEGKAGAWVDSAFDMAEKYMAKQYMLGRKDGTKPPYPEWEGAYRASGGPPRNTPAGSRSEALAGVYRLVRRHGLKEDARQLGDHLLAAAHFLNRQVYRPDNSFYLPNPEKAMWGLRGSMIDPLIRIDFNQHALVGVWGAWEAAVDRGGIGWPLPAGELAAELGEKVRAGALITRWGTRRPAGRASAASALSSVREVVPVPTSAAAQPPRGRGPSPQGTASSSSGL